MTHPHDQALRLSFLANFDRRGRAILKAVGAMLAQGARAALAGAGGRYTLREILGAVADLRTVGVVLRELQESEPEDQVDRELYALARRYDARVGALAAEMERESRELVRRRRPRGNRRSRRCRR